MATYNSTQAGNWNTDATWTEAGHPSANDDIVNIGHAVDYDVGDSALTWGHVTITNGGTLSLPTDADSTILFNATAILTINSGGKLSAGTEASPIGSSYACKFHWSSGSAARNVMVLDDGGEIEIWGDEDYYSATRKLTLESEWDASAGDILYVEGDQTTTWPAGLKFYLNKGYASGSYAGSTDYQTDADIFEIASLGSYDTGNDRTPITVVSGHGSTLTFLVGQKPLALSRNVEMGDPSIGIDDVYAYNSNTERLRFDNNQGSSNNLISINNTVIFGWEYAVDGGYNYSGTGLVFTSNNYGTYLGANHQITGDFTSNYHSISSGTNHQITGDLTSNNRGVYQGTNLQITGDLTSNDRGVYQGTNHQITGDLTSNYRGVYQGTNYQITGDLTSNNRGVYYGTNYQITGDLTSNYYGVYYGTNHQITGDFTSNTYGIYRGTSYQITGDFTANTNDTYGIASSDTKRSIIVSNSVMDSNLRALRIEENSGVFLPLISGESNFETPDSGNDWILEALPNSYCKDSFAMRMELNPLGNIGRHAAVHAEATDTTLTLKIWPVGWTTALDQNDIVLECLYLDDATGAGRTIVTNGTATYSNGAWRSVSATIAPAQDGMVFYNLYIKNYESGCYVLIDPVPVVS